MGQYFNRVGRGMGYAWSYSSVNLLIHTHHHLPQQEPGKPLFFSLLLYLNPSWPRNHDAETLFLDSSTDTGIMVRPRPGWAVLMDQVAVSAVKHT